MKIFLSSVLVSACFVAACGSDNTGQAAGSQPKGFQSDENCDGTPESCASFTYDANGNMLASQGGQTCDGTPESCWSYTY